MAFYSAQEAVHKTFSVTLAATVATTVVGSASPATNEVQTITMNDGHAATGGTYTITFDGQTTSGIAYNASAATITTALEALSNIGVGDVGVSGTLSGGLITITFQGALAATDVAEVTVSLASTTGTIYDRVILTGCHAGILRVRNHATSGAAVYFKAFPTAPASFSYFAAAADNTHVAPFSDLCDISWSNPNAYVYLVSASAQAYSVESLPGLN